MYYVYILHSKKDQKLYTGCTNDIKRRIQLHETGKVEATKNRRPLHLVFYEVFLNKHDAFMREQWLKTGWGRNHLINTLQQTLMQLKGKS